MKKRMRIGISDEEFIRGSLPMTKSEVRAMVMSRLSLAEDEIVYDIGSGTGSVSVEMALALPNGRVYAIEQKAEGGSLLAQNADKFAVENITFIQGRAPEAFAGLPAPDAVFIGGSSGSLQEMLEELLCKNPAVRVVLTALTIETVAEATDLMEKYEMEPEIISLSVSRSKKVGSRHLMLAQNPIYIISGRHINIK